jgi:hypothetical protein
MDEIDGEIVPCEWPSICWGGNVAGDEFLTRNELVDNHGARLDFQGERFVTNKCLAAIDNADIVMAWIDTPDCFGTLVEIGFAIGKYKRVLVAFSDSSLYRDMWFAGTIAKNYGVFTSPCDALTRLIAEESHA